MTKILRVPSELDIPLYDWKVILEMFAMLFYVDYSPKSGMCPMPAIKQTQVNKNEV